MKQLNKFFCWFIEDMIEKEWAHKSIAYQKSIDFCSFRNGFYEALNVLDLIEDPEKIAVMYHWSPNKDTSISCTEGK